MSIDRNSVVRLIENRWYVLFVLFCAFLSTDSALHLRPLLIPLTGGHDMLTSNSMTDIEPPLGALEPAPGLLPSGTTSVTLSLTTTAPADCRWSEEPDTHYASMPHDFQEGQGTTFHSTAVSGMDDLDELWVYNRCQDLPSERDPDDYERQTHLRVLGPWDGGYPRIANLWGIYDSDIGVDFFAGYDLFIPSRNSIEANQLAALRAANPNIKILLSQNATYGWPQEDSLTAEWWASSPGDPGYSCLLRNTNGEILLVDYWEHAMYNMTQSYCRDELVSHNIASFLSGKSDQGTNTLVGSGQSLAYDGLWWDRLQTSISWLGEDVDSDLDGQPDDSAALDIAYQAGVEDFLRRIRTRLPNAVLVGNGAPQDYDDQINGRLFETALAPILDGEDWLIWEEVISDYRDWSGRGQIPHATFLEESSEDLYSQKYTFQHLDQIPPAMEAEAAASYRRMRFGLTSALMGDGLFTYDYGGDWHGNLWWYDEYGELEGRDETLLPPRGYLGKPGGEPFLLVEGLEIPDQVTNGGFENGLNDWDWVVHNESGVSATLGVDNTGGVSNSAAAHIVVDTAAEPWSAQLVQFGKETVAGQNYTLSFWARSDIPRTIYGSVVKKSPPWTNYGFNVEALVTPQWQHFHLWDDTSVTANDGELEFWVSDSEGELWLDDIQFQSGALGVWARSFENGLVVVNSTNDVQKVQLPDTYCKLKGDQAPLYQVRVDDDEAQGSAGWSEQEANYDQFGATVQMAPAGNADTITYTPNLAYSGDYEILAWVAPSSSLSSAARITIHHAQGEDVVFLDETVGQVGWRSLGTYSFEVGEGGRALMAASGDGSVVADALKWVSVARYNDGSEVNQIILQPHDGIILLNSCYPAIKKQIYIPLVQRN